MKTQITTFIFLLCAISMTAYSQKTSKKVYRSYAPAQVEKLAINNKYGNIYVDDNRKDSVVIDVEIWVDGTNERAKRLLNDISVEINSTGKSINAETVFSSSFNSSQEFSIDYHVSIPADRSLTLTQKYGSISMGDLTGTGQFDVKYGELNAKKLLSPNLNMDIAYSKASVEATQNLKLVMRYSKFFLNNGEDLKLDTKYCAVNIGNVKSLEIESKYDDYKIQSAESMKSNTMYTGYRIEKIENNLEVINSYGNITINKIGEKFKNINVSNKYAVIRLGIPTTASYKLTGNVSYCELHHPDGAQMKRIRENSSYSVSGIIGKESQTTAVVKIESNFGNINLEP